MIRMSKTDHDTPRHRGTEARLGHQFTRRDSQVVRSALRCSSALGATLAGQSRTLLDAAKAGDSSAVRAQLAKKADPNVADADGSTALHWAVENDDAELTQALLAAGARARVANRHGVAPLHLAATNGNATIVQRLIAAGADVNGATPGGETPLMMAARTGDRGDCQGSAHIWCCRRCPGRVARTDRADVGRHREQRRGDSAVD